MCVTVCVTVCVFVVVWCNYYHTLYSGIHLNDAQHIEMEDLIKHIQSDPIAKSQLAAVLSENKDTTMSDLLQSVWKEEIIDNSNFLLIKQNAVSFKESY